MQLNNNKPENQGKTDDFLEDKLPEKTEKNQTSE